MNSYQENIRANNIFDKAMQLGQAGNTPVLEYSKMQLNSFKICIDIIGNDPFFAESYLTAARFLYQVDLVNDLYKAIHIYWNLGGDINEPNSRIFFDFCEEQLLSKGGNEKVSLDMEIAKFGFSSEDDKKRYLTEIHLRWSYFIKEIEKKFRINL